ncbi:MAG: RNA polymerase sigma-70 factor (ECF subfamily) [Alphaproteobacteria bacterium]|jgi:RNA polymerase sigma-70 factor (ECF subfamily)
MNWPTPSNAAVVVGLGGANADKLAPPPRAVDDALILQAQAGDRRAWGALVDRHLNAITGYAWYMLGDQGDAEDVAQETFLRLMGKVGTWQPDGGASLKTWLYRVAINLCIDRRRKRVPVPVEHLPEVDETEVVEMEQTLARVRAVKEALGRLPERQRAVMALVYYQGFTNRESADLLHLSVEAVESLLSRARRALSTSLAPLRDELMER